MSKGKYVSIFSRQMGAIVLIILILVTRGVLIIGGFHADISKFKLGDIQPRDTFRLNGLYI